jgi:hypothetical protein
MGEQEQSTRTVSGAAHMVAGPPSVRVTARVRSNFAVQHMLAAARFARRVGEVEKEHAGEQFGPFFDEIISYVSATILSSAAGLEAYINELFIEAETYFPEYRRGASAELWDLLWKRVERDNTLDKYQLALDLKKLDRFGKDKKSTIDVTYAAASALIDVRNALMHFKPQWDDEEKLHRQLTNRLRNLGIPTSPFMPAGTQHFPTAFMSHATAKWAVTTSLQFTAAFSQRAGLENKFAGFIERMNPGHPDWPSGITPGII